MQPHMCEFQKQLSGVFFRGDDQFGSGGFRVVDEVDHLLLAVTVMVGEMTLQNQFAAKLLKEKLKACGFRKFSVSAFESAHQHCACRLHFAV